MTRYKTRIQDPIFLSRRGLVERAGTRGRAMLFRLSTAALREGIDADQVVRILIIRGALAYEKAYRAESFEDR